jgi:hypothetical protein
MLLVHSDQIVLRHRKRPHSADHATPRFFNLRAGNRRCCIVVETATLGF